MATSVHLLTLGCARNDVDSEELAARLSAGGFEFVAEPADAELLVVNTCGFIEQAKKDSIDTLLAANDLKESGKAKAVVAVGCMAERYGAELQAALPEADGVLGFDSYPDIADRLKRILDGEHFDAHTPSDRRKLLPIAPVERSAHDPSLSVPGHAQDFLPAGVGPASGPVTVRRRLGSGPYAPLKIASGCDRRCAFCAIPAFRGSYLSRPAVDIVSEANWLVSQGVKEVMLVSENTSSYGKDTADKMALVDLLQQLNAVDGLEWIRVSYLQPAEIRPGLLETMAELDHVVPYFDLSMQHASKSVLRRMRRFGDPDSFLALLDRIRQLAPEAGIRSNFIVGFPGESEQEFAELCQFVAAARLDVAGVFGYSDEEGTEGATLPGHLDEDAIAERVAELSQIVDAAVDARAAERVGDPVKVLVESIEDEELVGRAAHQGPEVDGICYLLNADAQVGDFVDAVVIDSQGADLFAQAD